MKGKNRCRILKNIRRRIAEENGIEFATTECKYKGDCRGTCPKCEAEVRYLEKELEHRRSLGYKVTVAGLVTGLALTPIGCAPDEASNNSNISESSFVTAVTSYDESIVSENSIVSESSAPDSVSSEEILLMGEEPYESDTDSPFSEDIEIELMGDINIENIESEDSEEESSESTEESSESTEESSESTEESIESIIDSFCSEEEVELMGEPAVDYDPDLMDPGEEDHG